MLSCFQAFTASVQMIHLHPLPVVKKGIKLPFQKCIMQVLFVCGGGACVCACVYVCVCVSACVSVCVHVCVYKGIDQDSDTDDMVQHDQDQQGVLLALP